MGKKECIRIIENHLIEYGIEKYDIILDSSHYSASINGIFYSFDIILYLTRDTFRYLFLDGFGRGLSAKSRNRFGWSFARKNPPGIFLRAFNKIMQAGPVAG